MNIEKVILKEHTKENALKIANYMRQEENMFDELMQLLFHADYKTKQRAAWEVNFCDQNQPKLIVPYLKNLVTSLGAAYHAAVKRNILSIFQFRTLPEDLHGELLNRGFNLLMNRKEAIAIRVFSMMVINNLTEIYPEVKA